MLRLSLDVKHALGGWSRCRREVPRGRIASAETLRLSPNWSHPRNHMKSHLLLHLWRKRRAGDPFTRAASSGLRRTIRNGKCLPRLVRHGDQTPPAAQARSRPAATDALDFSYSRPASSLSLKGALGTRPLLTVAIFYPQSFHLETFTGKLGLTDEQSPSATFRVLYSWFVPGDPASSRLLIHPLAPRSGRRSVSFRWQAVCVTERP